jgi:hypothetical protein
MISTKRFFATFNVLTPFLLGDPRTDFQLAGRDAPQTRHRLHRRPRPQGRPPARREDRGSGLYFVQVSLR